MPPPAAIRRRPARVRVRLRDSSTPPSAFSARSTALRRADASHWRLRNLLRRRKPRSQNPAIRNLEVGVWNSCHEFSIPNSKFLILSARAPDGLAGLRSRLLHLTRLLARLL